MKDLLFSLLAYKSREYHEAPSFELFLSSLRLADIPIVPNADLCHFNSNSSLRKNIPELISSLYIVPQPYTFAKISHHEYYHFVIEVGQYAFHDDLELLIDYKINMISIRSASRVGIYDFGTNTNRINEIISFLS